MVLAFFCTADSHCPLFIIIYLFYVYHMQTFNQIRNFKFYSVTILNKTVQILQKALVRVINIVQLRVTYFFLVETKLKKEHDCTKFVFQNVAIYIFIIESRKTMSKLISICLNNLHTILNLIINISFYSINVKNLLFLYCFE